MIIRTPHADEARRLIDRADHYTYGDGADPVTGHAMAAQAQACATLALVEQVARVASALEGLEASR